MESCSDNCVHNATFISLLTLRVKESLCNILCIRISQRQVGTAACPTSAPDNSYIFIGFARTQRYTFAAEIQKKRSDPASEVFGKPSHLGSEP